MISKQELDIAREDVAIRAKQGIDFITAAVFIWTAVSFIWLQDLSSYNMSIYTLMAGGLLMPLAFLFSKIYKTEWSKGGNPIQPFGLWLNVAQLFYFPILILILKHNPAYFIDTFVIITGAHFFPFAWFYKQKAYAVSAGIIAIGALVLSLTLLEEEKFWIPVFMTVCLCVLAVWIRMTRK